MQASEFKSRFVRAHYVLALEGTNNTVFGNAHSLPIQDKLHIFPKSVKRAFEFPDSINTMFDYRNQIPAIYNRLYQLCVISLCSDIEFFFKSLFDKLSIQPPKGQGFFQRFDDVISTLSENGYDFSSLGNELAELNQAFMIRHVCIHNFGIVDTRFSELSRRSVSVGHVYTIDQQEYLRMFDSYRALLQYFDSRLSTDPTAQTSDIINMSYVS
jgi:hypothetical protein